MTMRTLVLLTALVLCACGEQTPPAARVKVEDIANFAARMLQGRPKPAEQNSPVTVPIPEPAPIVAPHKVDPVAASPVKKPMVAKTKAKAKAKPQPKKAKPGGVAGYSCATVRMAGSAASVEQMASARGKTVTPEVRRQIQACFNQG